MIPHRLPRSSVQIRDRLDQSRPVGVLEVEQGLQVPVEVIGEVADLLPQSPFGIALHSTGEERTSSTARRRGCTAGTSSSSSVSSNDATGSGSGAGAGAGGA